MVETRIAGVTGSNRDRGWESSFSAFERSLETCLGEQMRSSRAFAEEVWGGLTNLRWIHNDHGSIGFDYRAAGELVARIVGEGTWLTYYLQVPSGKAPDLMVERMGIHGWEVEPL